jgi:copper(I)-binding protein
MFMTKLSKAILLSASIFLSFPIQADVLVENAWLRLLPPVSNMTAAYMNLTSDREDRLVSISSDIAELIEIHQSKMESGVMSMQEVKRLSLPKGKTIELKPQSYHLMVMGLKEVLIEGEAYPFTLEFEHAGKMTIDVLVRNP